MNIDHSPCVVCSSEIFRAGYPKDDLKHVGAWPHDGEWNTYNQVCYDIYRIVIITNSDSYYFYVYSIGHVVFVLRNKQNIVKHSNKKIEHQVWIASRKL